MFIPVSLAASPSLPCRNLYTAGIWQQKLKGGFLPATPTAGGAALQRNLQTPTAKLWSILI